MNEKTKQHIENLKSDRSYEYVLCTLFGSKLGVEFLQAHEPVINIKVVFCKVFFTAHKIMKAAMANLNAEW